MLILSNLDIDARQRDKFLADRLVMFRKPVKQNTLKNLLQEIQKRERSLLPHLILSQQHKMKSLKLQRVQHHSLTRKEMGNRSGEKLQENPIKVEKVRSNPNNSNHSLTQLEFKKQLNEKEISIQTPAFTRRSFKKANDDYQQRLYEELKEGD